MDANLQDVNLQGLENIINASAWLRDNEPEPSIGEGNCPAEADPYGTRELSVYTAFITNQDGDAYGCKYERCRAYSARSMEEVVRHLRHHHFDHSPYVCVPVSGNTWYVSVFSHTRALVGNHKIDRLNRAVDHQRARWGYKPFTCEDPRWYDASTSVVICFFAD